MLTEIVDAFEKKSCAQFKRRCKCSVRIALLAFPYLVSEIRIENVWPVAAAIRAIPFTLRFVRETEAVEMVPFDFAFLVIASNHFAIRNLRMSEIMSYTCKLVK